MIIQNNKTFSALYKGTKEIVKRYKGTQVIYEAFKKLIASGVPPITLLKCKNANLVDYKIYGDSKQQNKNLFSLTSYEGVVDWGTNDKNTMNKVTVKPNTYYTLSFQNFERIDPITGGGISIYIYNNASLSETGRVHAYSINVSGSAEPIRNTETFNSGNNTELYVVIRNTSGTKTQIKIEGMMLEEGSTATEYVSPIPTPDNPIEIESVGDRTKNYLDIEHLGNISNWDAVPVYASYEMSLPNGNYYFNFETELESYSGHILFLSKKKSTSSSPVATLINGYNGIQAKQGSFTISDNEKIYFNWHCGSRNQTNLTKLVNDVLNNFIIEQGDTFTGYEPYGYKIPVKVSGKNLIPYPYYYTTRTINDVTFTVNNDGSITLNGTASADNTNFLITYTSGFQLDTGNYVISGAPEGATRDNGVYMVWQNKAFVEDGKAQKITMTEKGNVYIYIAVKKGTVCDNLTFKPQIEKGSTTTAYEPYYKSTTNIYLKEPLRKIGETSDYIDFEKQKVIRNIATATLDGKVVWSAYGTNEKYYGYIRDFDFVSMSTSGIKCLCNRSKGLRSYGNVWYGRELGCYAGPVSSTATKTHFVISSEKPTVAEFREEINEKPLDIIYTAREQKEEDITLPNITLNKGTNIIEIDTSILPSNMEVKYMGKGKNELLDETESNILNSILNDSTETELDMFDSEIEQTLDEIIGG